MAWVESHQELRSHPKTARLRRRLGIGLPQAIGHLHLLWWWALDYAEHGDLSGHDPDVIADAGGWEDEPGVFLRALIAAGFVDENLRIHDWDDYAGRLIDRREANARRMREARRARRGEISPAASCATRAPDDTAARAAHVRGLPDQTGPNSTGPDRTTPTPTPSPLGKGTDRGGRNGGESSGTSEAVPAPELLPATDDDRRVWNLALEHLPQMTPTNRERIEALEPAGRAPDGGLWLTAPFGEAGWLARARPLLARALDDAGDAAAERVGITEASLVQEVSS